jgi:fatty acid desaturase
MDVMTAGAAGLFLLAVGEVPNYLSGVLPSWMTIRRFSADERDTVTLRAGEAFGAGFAVLVGAGASLIASSWWPLIGTLVAAGLLICGYEWAIRHPHDDARPINDQGGWQIGNAK